MVKRIILFLLQFAAFLALMFIGGDWAFIRLGQELRAMTSHTTFFNPIPVYKVPFGATHILILNGVIFASVLLLLILLIEAIRKAIKPWAAITLVAYILAVGLALVLKVGVPPAPTPDSDNSSITLPQVSSPA